MKAFLVFFLILISDAALSQGGLSKTYKTLGGISSLKYEFYPDGKLKVKFHGCMSAYERQGTYKKVGDSVFIKFTPLTEVENLPSSPDDSLFIQFIEQSTEVKMGTYRFELFRNGEKKILRTDSSGFIVIPRYREIDSIYFPPYAHQNLHLKILTYEIQSNHLKIRLNLPGWSLSGSRNLNTLDTLIAINSHKLVQANTKFYKSYYYDSTLSNYAFRIDSSGLISYEIPNMGDTFILEQMRFNKWETVDTLHRANVDSIIKGYYRLNLHSGINEIYIKLKQDQSFRQYLSINSEKKPAKAFYRKASGQIYFTNATYYELTDQYGRIVLKGIENKIDLSPFAAGTYFLQYDSGKTRTIKKKL